MMNTFFVCSLVLAITTSRVVVSFYTPTTISITINRRISSPLAQTTTTYAKTRQTRNDRNTASRRQSPTSQQKSSPVENSKTSSTSTSTSHFFSKKSIRDPAFRYNNDNKSIFESLVHGAEIDRPSKIQSLAWPVLLSGKNAVVADQTGSGKTLAYLVPLLQRMLVLDNTMIMSSSSTTSTTTAAATPKILILAPTAELADQIYTVCQKIASSSSATDDKTTSSSSLFSTVVLTATGKFATNIRDQIRMLQQKKNVDVLISTPGRIATILRTRHCSDRILNLNQLQAVVLDEVDVLLLDETFGPQLQTVGEATADSTSTQFVFVTATLPDTVVTQVLDQFPDAALVKGPGLHRVAPTVKERLVDVSVPSTLNRNAAACFNVKATALQQALRQNRCKRTLVFCNTVESCRKVENLLQRRDRKKQIYAVRAYHNAMTAEARKENLDYFAKSSEIIDIDENDYSSSSSRVNNNNRRRTKNNDAITDRSFVLVCTDRAARGVDFAAAAVDHVVIFDFPVDPAEYVRRVGRTARAGRDGAVTILAYGWQLPIARSVMGQQSGVKNFTGKNTFINDDDEEGGDIEYGLQAKRRSKQKERGDAIIRKNIAGGKLWK